MSALDRERVREAFVEIVETEQPALRDYLVGLLDAAFGATRSTQAEGGLDVERLRMALVDAAVWLEAEAEDLRPDPRPAMRLQAQLIRAALTATREEPAG